MQGEIACVTGVSLLVIFLLPAHNRLTFALAVSSNARKMYFKTLIFAINCSV